MPLRRIALTLLSGLLLRATDPAWTDRGSLPPLRRPARPEVIPNDTERDPSTGLHMTGTPQFIDAVRWRLQVTGRVSHPLRLTFDDLRRMRRVTSKDPLICRGYFEDYATWAGAPLLDVLKHAGMDSRARHIELISADGYRSEVGLDEIQKSGAFLAYEWEGKALPELHGYPVRAVFPGSPGYQWVKWLVEIRVR